MKSIFLFLIIFCCVAAHAQTIPLNSGITVASQQSVEGKQYKIVAGKHVPWASSTEFLSTIASSRRHIGQVAYIDNGTSIDVWQFVGGITNSNFKSLTDTLKLVLPLFKRNDSVFVNLKSGSVSQSVSSATTVVVTFGGTQSDANYRIAITPTSDIAETASKVTTKTTTTFTVTYASAITGTCSFDWILTR